MSNSFIGRVYKITNPESDDCYVGSTIYPLRDRFVRHLYCMNNEATNKRPLYKAMLNLPNEKWEIILLEELECDNLDQLRIREDHYINQLNPNLNQRISFNFSRHNYRVSERKKYKKTYFCEYCLKHVSKRNNRHCSTKNHLANVERDDAVVPVEITWPD